MVGAQERRWNRGGGRYGDDTEGESDGDQKKSSYSKIKGCQQDETRKQTRKVYARDRQAGQGPMSPWVAISGIKVYSIVPRDSTGRRVRVNREHGLSY